MKFGWPCEIEVPHSLNCDNIQCFFFSFDICIISTANIPSSHSYWPMFSELFFQEWKIGPTVLTLCEHLFVSFAIRILRKGVARIVVRIPWNKESNSDSQETNLSLVPTGKLPKGKFIWTMGIGKFMLSGILAYIDGTLCRNIPCPIVRRIVSGFLLSLLDNNDKE